MATVPEQTGESRLTPRAAATRRRVLDTARECLLELGPLGATSNEIARRAGVSWGVIQYHFGTKEGILLAAVEDRFDTLLDALDLDDALAETTPGERIALVADAIWIYCSQPEYMLTIDVLRLLSRDDEWADAVAVMLRRAEQKLTRRLNGVLRHAVADENQLAVVRSLIFATMRGLALRQAFSRSSSPASRVAAAERQLLVRALQLALTTPTD